MKIKEVSIGNSRKLYYKASFIDVLFIKHFKLMVVVDLLLFVLAVVMGVKIING